MRNNMKYFVLFFLSVVWSNQLLSQQPNYKIKKVHLIFKTHLDIGFTQLSSEVEKKYINEFIPKAIATIDQLRAENAPEHYVWTTGAWLISEYLKKASPEAVKKFKAAIQRGDIVWIGVPYTVESEMMSKELFATCLKLSQQLDQEFGKKTIAAKMTDVPGHTRSIVTPLSDAGMTFLHIGVNGASAVPQVPPLCRWRNTDGKEIVLMYQGNYGDEMILPDSTTVVSINFTSDNHGPHTINQIKKIYADERMKYPNAKIEATSLNEVAKDLQTMLDKIPVLTSEIGDTWIYGYGSFPLRLSRYRALSRLYSQWVNTGKMDMNSSAAINFAVCLGLIPEHTKGLDVKTFLKDWDKYDVDIFNQSRNLPEFKLIERSWAEIDEDVNKAIALLPESLQKEANKELENIVKVETVHINSHDNYPGLNAHGAYQLQVNGLNLLAGELAYQTYSAEDYSKYQDAYLRFKNGWAVQDFGKPGLENTKAKSATIVPDVKNCQVTRKGKNTMIQCVLQFPENKNIDSRILPESTTIEYNLPESGKSFEMKVSLRNKPANRLPEAYLLSFIPSDVVKIFAEKMGFKVDVSDVVAGGNRQMHAIDNFVDIVTTQGTIRITSLDAPIVVVGERKMLNYSTKLPNLKEGVHFCLFNNLWGTNFSMWFEGSITYRFNVELIK